MQPGQVITPHDSDEPKQPGAGAPPEPTRPLEKPGSAPTPPPASVPPREPASASTAGSTDLQAKDSVPDAGWQFDAATDTTPVSQGMGSDEVSWTASEFVLHDKSAGWYSALILGGLVAAVADYLVWKDRFSAGVIVIVTIFFALFAARKPREQNYALSRQGVRIGAKTYRFQEFKNFSVIEDGSTISVVFMPLKRFMPALTVYVVPDVEEQVFDFLSSILPFEQHRVDAVDSLMRRIHL